MFIMWIDVRVCMCLPRAITLNFIFAMVTVLTIMSSFNIKLFSYG